MLKCQCGAELELRIGYTGADWDTEAGEDSGFGHVISLACPNDRCGLIYDIGHVQRPGDFSPLKEGRRCVKKGNI